MHHPANLDYRQSSKPAARSPDLGSRSEWSASGPPPVSVIIPARNAEATLPATLDAILSQDYPGDVEVIVADGSDTSSTAALVARRYPGVVLVPNPDRGIAAGLNRALAAARHPVVVRCDAHAVLRPGYVARAVEILERTGAANVGGRVNPVGSTRFERAVALATTTWLGAGDARYRVGGAAGPVDTVFPGVFRRDALNAAGGFDETLLRNEDYELNWRLRARGETVWFAPELVADYRPRASFRALARQYFEYGRWKRVVLRRHPRSLRARQLAPPLLLLGLGASALLAIAARMSAAAAPVAEATLLGLAATPPLAYGGLLLAAAAVLGLRRRRPEAVLVPAVLATIHLSWALGFFAGGPRRPGGGDGHGACRLT